MRSGPKSPTLALVGTMVACYYHILLLLLFVMDYNRGRRLNQRVRGEQLWCRQPMYTLYFKGLS